MKQLFGILFLIAVIVGCTKEKTPTPTVSNPTKWELVTGHYKVYDSTGVFIYEMDITHSTGTSQQGYRTDSLCFNKFDNQFDFTAVQNQSCTFSNCIRIGVYSAVEDSVSNRWNIFGYGSDGVYNTFQNDTIVFYFQKQNMPYWWNDGTQYFNGNLKYIAVKQH